MTSLATSLSQQLTGILGGDGVLSEDRLGEYSIDGLVPKAVALPEGREGVAKTMRWAAEEGIAVFPRGGGTQISLGNIPGRVDLVLDLTRCNRVLDYQPADLTVTVESGISLDSLQKQLAQGGKFLALEAAWSERATIGGILASNSSGPLRFAYGLPRDWLIGIGVVSAQGVETKAGGKVVKNVTGYDLDKLYTGSLGTLAVIVEATFKLSPLTTDSGVLVAAFPSIQRALDAGAQLLRQVYSPQGVQVVSGQAARRLNLLNVQQDQRHFAVEETPEGQEPKAVALAFFAGRTRAVQRKLMEATKLFNRRGASQVAAIGGAQGGTLLRRLTDLGGTEDAAPYLALKVSVLPSAVGQVVGWFGQPASSGPHDQSALSQLETQPEIVADPGFGLVHILWWAEADDSALIDAIGWIRAQARELGGSVVVEHAPLAVKRRIDVWGEAPEGIEIMRRIKQKFDPSGILNPGRFVGGI